MQCQIINSPYHACAMNQIMPSINDVQLALISRKEVYEVVADNDDTIYRLSLNEIMDGQKEGIQLWTVMKQIREDKSKIINIFF